MAQQTATDIIQPSISRKWRETIDGAKTDERWNAYDGHIHRILAEFNAHLMGEKGYRPLEWRLIKAMIWTESGGPSTRAWSSRPMQIGNPGDPGLRALLQAAEGGALIIPPAYRHSLTIASAVSSAEMNIRAGVAYLLMRLAKFDFASVLDSRDASIHEVVVRSGDSFSRIAAKEGTTIHTLKNHNPTTAILRPGQRLKYRKASLRKVIVGWEQATPETAARLYNVGDPGYATKLRYCLSVMQMSERNGR